MDARHKAGHDDSLYIVSYSYFASYDAIGVGCVRNARVTCQNN
jgi:hypothetical protein